MLMKVSELTGRALNYAVALTICEQHRDIGGGQTEFMIDGKWWVVSAQENDEDETEFDPRCNWAHGGPLIEKFGIWLMCDNANVAGRIWWRSHPLGGAKPPKTVVYQRPLKAAMIALVWFKSGSCEIEIPDELCEVAV